MEQIKEKPKLNNILKIITSTIAIFTVIISVVTSYNNLSNSIDANKTAIELNALNIVKEVKNLEDYKDQRAQIDLRMLSSIESVEKKLGDVKISNAVVIERVGNIKSQISSLKRNYIVEKR